MRVRAVVVAVVAAVLLTLVGSSGVGPASAAGSASGDCTAAKKGGEVTISTLTAPPGLDPLGYIGIRGAGGGTEDLAMYDTLMRWNRATNKYEPWLAQKLEPNADFTQWTVTLRDGIKFGNGDRLTAASVKSHIERAAADTSLVTVRGLVSTVSRMDVLNDLTIVFNLSQPWPQFGEMLADAPGAITNSNVVSKVGVRAFATNPTGGGAGPYEFERFAAGEEIVLKAKDDYWGGPVCIQRLRFRVVGFGDQATYDSFKTGGLQNAYMRDPDVVAQIKKDKVKSDQALSNMSWLMVYNNESGPTKDLRVRQALTYALDTTGIASRAFRGGGYPQRTILHTTSRFYTKAMKAPEYNPTKAADLVKQLKTEGVWDGRIRFSGPEVYRNASIAAQAMLEKAGITVDNLVGGTGIQANTLYVAGDFQLHFHGVTGYDEAMWDVISRDFGATVNRSRYNSPAFRAAHLTLRQARTQADRQKAFVDMQEIWNRELPALPWAASMDTIIYGSNVRGVVPGFLGALDFSKAWISSK